MSLNNTKNTHQRWYVCMVVSFYAVICGTCSIHYLYQTFTSTSSVPLHKQVLCYMIATFSIVYFFRRQIGHIGLIIASCLTVCLAIMTNEKYAAVWHATALFILCLPFWKSASGWVREQLGC